MFQATAINNTLLPSERAAMDLDRAVQQLKELAAQAPESMRETLSSLGDVLSVGSVTNSTGVAVGRNIRQVINQFNLSPEAAAALLELRQRLGTDGTLDVEHLQLAPLIAEKCHGFIGRDYVFEEIDRFVATQRCGYFTIVADPGMGKSAVLAELARRTGCLAHFNVRSLGVNTAAPFIQNICAQLIAEAGLPHTTLPSGATDNGAFLLKLIHEAARALAPQPLVIAIDALDEVDSAHLAGANLLFLPRSLPDGVYVVMTRRNVEVPLVIDSPQRTLDMMDHRAENRGDVEAYLARAVARDALQRWIGAQPRKADGEAFSQIDFVQQLAELSENNFMYLRHVLPEIEQGFYRSLSIDRLPLGLEGYYSDHWSVMGMQVKPLPRAKIRIVYVLCEALQPIPADLIARFATDASLTIDRLDAQEVLDDWQQFLTKQRIAEVTVYSIYHASFRDFLHRRDIVQGAGISLPQIHRLIADNLWERLLGAEQEVTLGDASGH